MSLPIFKQNHSGGDIGSFIWEMGTEGRRSQATQWSSNHRHTRKQVIHMRTSLAMYCFLFQTPRITATDPFAYFLPFAVQEGQALFSHGLMRQRATVQA